MAAKLLAPLLLAAAGKIDGSMRDVVGWVDSGEQKAVNELLLDLGEPDAHAAFLATCRREERTLSSVYATTEAVLAPFGDPAVLASTALRGVDPEALLEGQSTLYIVAPSKDQERLAPLFAGLVEHIVDAAFARAASGRPCEPSLMLVLDEAVEDTGIEPVTSALQRRRCSVHVSAATVREGRCRRLLHPDDLPQRLPQRPSS